MSPSLSNTWVALLVAILAGAPLRAPAQAPALAEPPSLTALRAEFLGQMVAGSRQLTEQFANALVRLEDELAATGDYEDAIKVQNRRKEVEALLAQPPASVQNPGIAMDAGAAKVSSTVVLDGDSLSGWRTSGSYAEWTLQKLTPGRYTFQLSYILANAPATANGEPSLASRFSAVDVAKFKLSEVSLLGAAAANTRLLELKRSSDAATWAVVTTEPVSILRSSITLRLEALQGYPSNSIRIKDVRLIPVEQKPAAAVAASAALAPTGAKDVETLRQRFAHNFAAACEPVITDYLAHLKTLAAQPSVANDRELLAEIETEQKRVVGKTALLSGEVARKRGSAGVSGGLDGFEDLAGARLVPDPANTAGRFKVQHEGRQFWIKLAWVRCPPATADDKDSLHLAMKHFKIDEDDALAIGRMAGEFTLGYLEDRPLRLLVRSNKNPKDDAAPALVFLDDLGLFQMVLVDRGLAALALPPGSGDHKSTNETAMMKMLSDHEQQAMKRHPAPGAWSFRMDNPPLK